MMRFAGHERYRNSVTSITCGLLAMTVAVRAGAECDPLEVAELLASDMTDSNYFGYPVAIDGDTAVVGAWGANAPGTDFCGAAYVFVSDGMGAWSQQAKLTASDPHWRDYFGLAVAIDGDTVVVGSYGTDDVDPNNPDCNSGSAYVFVRDAFGQWSQQAKLSASDAVAGDLLGKTVAISGDTTVTGAWSKDDAGENSGAAYVFARDGGGIWTQQAKLTASDAVAWAAFGNAVAVDGDCAIIGAHNDNDGVNAYGAAYAFTRDGVGAWSQQAKLTASDAVPWACFGNSVAIDGNTALIGAFCDNDGVSVYGAAYAFTHDGEGTWSQQAKLTAPDGTHEDYFGSQVAIDDDKAVIGTPYDDDACLTDPNCNSGSAHVFTRSRAGAWTFQGKATASDAAAGDNFGDSVAISGDVAVLGVYGMVRVFDLSECESPLLGDCDCDGSTDIFDIDAFIMAILFPAEYAATYPDCNVLSADCNGDGMADLFDIDAFVATILR